MTKSPITTHVLDTARGRPAQGLDVVLEYRDGDHWRPLGRGTTDADGRVTTLLAPDHPLEAGVYRLVFATEAWQPGFFPEVVLTFRAHPGEHYHVPLLLSPYGYTTYRGS